MVDRKDKRTMVFNFRDDGVQMASEMYRSRYYSIEELLLMLNDGKLKYLPESGRNGWSKSQKSRIVETVLLGQPQPVLMIDTTGSDWYVIVGINELKSLEMFVKGKVSLSSVAFRSDDYANGKYESLPFYLKRRLMNYKFQVTLVDCGDNKLSRLWVYTTELYRRGITSQRTCRMVIFPETYKKLSLFAEEIGCNGNEDDIWMLMVMSTVLRYKQTEDYMNNEAYILDFGLYLSMCMTMSNAIFLIFQSGKQNHRKWLVGMIEVLKSFKNIPSYSIKKRRCLAILMACFDWHPLEKDLIGFIQKWNDCIDLKRQPHKGNSMANYLACGFTMAKELNLVDK